MKTLTLMEATLEAENEVEKSLKIHGGVRLDYNYIFP